MAPWGKYVASSEMVRRMWHYPKLLSHVGLHLTMMYVVASLHTLLSTVEGKYLKPETLGSIPGGTTFLSFPLLFQRSSDNNGPDYLRLDDLHQSSACGGVPFIGLPML